LRYMDMTPEQLRAAYRETRRSIATFDGMATPGHDRRTRGRIAGGVFAGLDRLDLIVNVARKRGISL
jgi:hypothetical protein